MNVIYIVLPLALVLSAVAVVAFLWATRRGQFDDMNTPAMRILHDDEGKGRRVSEGQASRPKSS